MAFLDSEDIARESRSEKQLSRALIPKAISSTESGLID